MHLMQDEIQTEIQATAEDGPGTDATLGTPRHHADMAAGVALAEGPLDAAGSSPDAVASVLLEASNITTEPAPGDLGEMRARAVANVSADCDELPSAAAVAQAARRTEESGWSCVDEDPEPVESNRSSRPVQPRPTQLDQLQPSHPTQHELVDYIDELTDVPDIQLESLARELGQELDWPEIWLRFEDVAEGPAASAVHALHKGRRHAMDRDIAVERLGRSPPQLPTVAAPLHRAAWTPLPIPEMDPRFNSRPEDPVEGHRSRCSSCTRSSQQALFMPCMSVDETGMKQAVAKDAMVERPPEHRSRSRTVSWDDISLDSPKAAPQPSMEVRHYSCSFSRCSGQRTAAQAVTPDASPNNPCVEWNMNRRRPFEEVETPTKGSYVEETLAHRC